MAIKSFKLISLEDFKEGGSYDTTLAESANYNDNYINEAIETSSNIINEISGFLIKKEFEFLDQKGLAYTNIQTACARQTQYFLRAGVEYMRGNDSMSHGGLSYNSSRPDQPFYVVPEVFSLLRECGYYTDFASTNLDKPKKDLGHWENLPTNNIMDKDGEYSGYTRKQADAKFMGKDGTLVSTDNTITITQLNNYENRGQGNLQVRGENVSHLISGEVLADIKKSVITSKEFKEAIPNGIANEFLDNENLNELISEILAQFISSTPELTEIYIRGLEKALLKNQEWQNELVVKLLENEKLISELKALTSKIAKEEVENALSDFKPNIEKVVVDPSKELGVQLGQDTSTIKDYLGELQETIKAITPGIVRTQIGQPDMNPELGEEIPDYKKSWYLVITKTGSFETLNLTPEERLVDKFETSKFIAYSNSYSGIVFERKLGVNAVGVQGESSLNSPPLRNTTFLDGVVKQNVDGVQKAMTNFILYVGGSIQEIKEVFGEESEIFKNVGDKREEKVWRFKGGTKDNGIGNIVRNRKIGDYKFEENETDKYNTMVAEGNRIKVLPNSQALLEIQNGASFFELINPQLIVQNPKLAELEGDYYDLDFNKCYVSNEGNFVFRLNVGLDQTELEKSRRALEKVEVYGTCLKYVAPVEPEPEPEEDK